MSGSITVATWSLNNLYDKTMVTLRSRAPARSESDDATLRKYAQRMAVDVIAFQEVNGPSAAKRVFPSRPYELVGFDRFCEDGVIDRHGDSDHCPLTVRLRWH